jgi:hypothetical protein
MTFGKVLWRSLTLCAGSVKTWGATERRKEAYLETIPENTVADTNLYLRSRRCF